MANLNSFTDLLEQKYVYEIYDEIAQQFHQTRHSLWTNRALPLQVLCQLMIVSNNYCNY